jgi:hypothetical protein
MRLKIIAGNAAVILLVGIAAFIMVNGQLRTELLRSIDNEIVHDRELLDRSFRLSANQFVQLTAQRAQEQRVRDVFSGLDLDSRRTRAFEAAQATHGWFSDPARGERGGPDLVVVVDETGKVIARNGARNVMFGKELRPLMPALDSVLSTGHPTHDAWLDTEQNEVLQIAVATIRAETGATLGALVVGYDLSNGAARREADVLGREVAFVVGDKVYSSSLDGGVARSLRDRLFGDLAATTKAVLEGQRQVSEPWQSSLGSDDYIGVLARMPMAPSIPVAFAVLGNRSDEAALADVTRIILLMTAIGFVLVVLYGFVIGNAVMRPIEQIEEGVLAVINGRTDLRLETDSAELGGLAFRINQLLNVLTGTEEQTEDEQGGVSVPPSRAAWQDSELNDASGRTPAAGAAGGSAPGQDDPIEDAALAERLAAEDEAAYGTRIFTEYAAAKKAVGEDVGGIPQERFVQRLKGRADALAGKHGCRLVRFQVETHGSQVMLRPVLIR